eukprot:TRINITY_DN6318_c0_g1_i4.p1 TRINITY_DN6318_c0_g1~~TRINITY_DN6318_c0_g1_i4.p1  ORF type:complete len:592 (+),score=163.12 TRINITY_DN6318_c0_g1_i4:150-1925(+)
MQKTTSSADLDAESIKSNGEEKEKSLQDKALDGTITSSDFMGFIVEYIRRQNTENLKTSECSLSKSQLDWNLKGNPCPVVEFNDSTNYVTDTLKIFNNSKSRKVFFNIELIPNPKFSVVYSPDTGVIPKNGSVEIIFKMHAFCTTKVYQMFKISLSLSKRKDTKTGTVKKTGLFSKKTKDDEIGQLFASFKVESELSASIDFDEIKMGDQLAKGGYGTVYKGEWRTTEVAVKVLNTQELIEEERENVRREITLMKKLNYSYIVTYMGASQVQGQKIAIVMEYVRGGSLTDLLKKEISDRFKCKLCLDVAKGMAFLHSHNIYHRDIKPDNMLVFSPHPDSFVNLKITDFGTSRASTLSSNRMMDPAYQAFNDLSQLKPEQQKQTRRMTKGIGTLIYQAPEIIRGDSEYSIDKTDIYSFGVLLLEVFTQKEPYSEPPYDKWTKWELEKFVSSGKRIEIPNNIPGRIRELIGRCWDQTPVKRPDFATIVKIITEVMESFPTDQGEPQPAVKRITSQGSMKNMPTSPTPKSGVPVPNGNVASIGWVGEWERKECEAKLKGMPVGTFMLRWSQNTTSYVLTYQNKTGMDRFDIDIE